VTIHAALRHLLEGSGSSALNILVTGLGQSALGLFATLGIGAGRKGISKPRGVAGNGCRLTSVAKHRVAPMDGRELLLGDLRLATVELQALFLELLTLLGKLGPLVGSTAIDDELAAVDQALEHPIFGVNDLDLKLLSGIDRHGHRDVVNDCVDRPDARRDILDLRHSFYFLLALRFATAFAIRTAIPSLPVRRSTELATLAHCFLALGLRAFFVCPLAERLVQGNGDLRSSDQIPSR
jgi:hypothetical protein